MASTDWGKKGIAIQHQTIDYMKQLVAFLVGICICTAVFSADTDSVLILKHEGFFNEFKTRKQNAALIQLAPSALIESTYSTINNRPIQVFALANQLYVHVNGSGILYALDRTENGQMIFKRIDKTTNISFYQQAFLFTYKNQIYQLIHRNQKDQPTILNQFNSSTGLWVSKDTDESLLLPASKDIYWFNPTEQKVFVPFLLDEEDQYNKRVYELSLEDLTWDKRGKTHADLFDLLINASFKIPTDIGLLVSYKNKIYQIDFKENDVYEINNLSLANQLQKLKSNDAKYYDKGRVYYLDSKTGNTGFINIPTNQFEDADLRVWKRNSSFFPFWIIIIIIIASNANKKKQKQNDI